MVDREERRGRRRRPRHAVTLARWTSFDPGVVLSVEFRCGTVWALAAEPVDGCLPPTPLRLATILGMLNAEC